MTSLSEPGRDTDWAVTATSPSAAQSADHRLDADLRPPIADRGLATNQQSPTPRRAALATICRSQSGPRRSKQIPDTARRIRQRGRQPFRAVPGESPMTRANSAETETGLASGVDNGRPDSS